MHLMSHYRSYLVVLPRFSFSVLANSSVQLRNLLNLWTGTILSILSFACKGNHNAISAYPILKDPILSTTQNKQLVPYSMKARHDGLNSEN